MMEELMALKKQLGEKLFTDDFTDEVEEVIENPEEAEATAEV